MLVVIWICLYQFSCPGSWELLKLTLNCLLYSIICSNFDILNIPGLYYWKLWGTLASACNVVDASDCTLFVDQPFPLSTAGMFWARMNEGVYFWMCKRCLSVYAIVFLSYFICHLKTWSGGFAFGWKYAFSDDVIRSMDLNWGYPMPYFDYGSGTISV